VRHHTRPASEPVTTAAYGFKNETSPKQGLFGFVSDFYRQFAPHRAGEHVLGHVGERSSCLVARGLDIWKF
jgi:hypothetical protein